MKRSFLIAALITVMINLLVFVYVPVMRRAAHLQATAAAADSTAHQEPSSGAASVESLGDERRAERKRIQQRRRERRKEYNKALEEAATIANATGASAVPVAYPKNQKKTQHPKDIDTVEEVFDMQTFISKTELASTVYNGLHTKPNQADQLNRTKIVGFITSNYAKVAMRWYDRLELLGYTNHYIVCTESETFENFVANFSHYRVEASYLPDFPQEYVALRYGKKQRHRVKMLFAHRWVYLLQQLEAGHHVLMTDVDNIYSKYYPLNILESSEYDVYHALETKHPTDVYEYQGFVFCGGMGWFRSSQPTIRFIKDMVFRCGIECDDQVLLNRIIAYVLNIEWHLPSSGKNASTTERNADIDEHVERFANHFDRIVGLVTTGFTGYSKATGAKIKVWDRDFAYRGKNDPTDCPLHNWVTMPFVVFTSRWEGPYAKLTSYDVWDKACPNDFTNLSVGLPRKHYRKMEGI